MKTKIIIGIALGFVLGFLAHGLFPHRSDTARHWRAVERFNVFMQNPSNYRPDTNTGFSMTTPPYDPEPHLASLVEAGELRHLDIVLPSVPKSRATTSHWMAFCDHHRNVIVFASGNPSWVAFKPKGTQPMHLNLWYKPIGEEIVQQLIAELENTEPEKEPTGRTLPAEAAAPGVQ